MWVVLMFMTHITVCRHVSIFSREVCVGCVDVYDPYHGVIMSPPFGFLGGFYEQY